MTNIPATEFKAKCLALMDRVAERQESYVITKRGKPVARLVPLESQDGDQRFRLAAGQGIHTRRHRQPCSSIGGMGDSHRMESADGS